MGDHDHRVVLGDCLDPVSGLASLPDKSVDHVITDPPYEAEAHTAGRRIKTVGDGGNYGTTGGCVLDFAPITDEQRRAAAEQFGRLARRWVIVFCQVEAVASWRDALVAAGLSYRRTCAWLKSDAQPQLSGDRPGMGYESIVCAHTKGRSQWNGGGKRGVYETARASTLAGRPALHMTEKPLPLMEALVRDFTDEGETVLDPFAGSGTTGVACRRLGRRFIGFEKDAKYHAIAVKRIAAAREQFRMFEASATGGAAPKNGPPGAEESATRLGNPPALAPRGSRKGATPLFPAAPSSEDAPAPSPSPSAALSAGRGSDGRSA